jgi:methanogenic corrinoid protein MtbC1
MLNAWIMAMHGTIKPINSDELIQPLRFLVQHLDVFINNWEISDKLESDKQKGLVSLLLEKRRRDTIEYVVSFIEKGNSPDDICHDILMPVMKQIGLLWQKNKISVSDEHAATAIAKYIVFRIFDSIPRKPTIPYSSLVGCVPGEEHVLGAEMVTSHLEIEGWSVCYVGQGAPVEDMLEIINKSSPNVVFLSNTLISKLPLAVEISKRLREIAPEVKIIMGGHAAIVAKDMIAKLVDAVIDDYRKAHFEAIEILEGNA